MAFVCDGCHEKGTGKPGSSRHMAVSYGRCEICGQPASCFDCKCQFRQGWNDAEKADIAKSERGTGGTDDLPSLSKLPDNAAARDVMLHILHWTGNMEGLTLAGKCVYLMNALNHAVNYLYSLPAETAASAKNGIYTASRTRHAGIWQAFRQEGFSIVATWIDEAGPGETADMGELWQRCIQEAKNVSALVLYREDNEPLKGALVEVGAALANGVPVFTVGCGNLSEYSWLHHPLVRQCATLREAMLFAENEADCARIAAMPQDEIRKELEAAGIDLTETKRKMHERMQSFRESEFVP